MKGAFTNQADQATAVDLVIESRPRESTGCFKVCRVLPLRKKNGRTVHFFDEMGPELLTGGRGLDGPN